MAGGFALRATWYWGRSGQTLYTHVIPPNTWSCAYSNGNTDSISDAITAMSRHPGVVNALMLDGSVRAVKSSVTPQTWWALGPRRAARSSAPTAIEPPWPALARRGEVVR